jgi:UDP-GlcNAc3NAcA epimerase
MYDAAVYYGSIAAPSAAIRRLREDVGDRFCLCTIHRAENTDRADQLKEIYEAIESIAADCPVLVPLHPRTRKQLDALRVGWRNVRALEPVSYFDMLSLLRACHAVLTDSGGLQKEAFFFGKPCLTLRAETEWVELVDLGVNVLGGVQHDSILRGWRLLQERTFDFSARPYGTGQAGRAVVEILAGQCIAS